MWQAALIWAAAPSAVAGARLWGYPKCWSIFRSWGNHGVGRIRDDEDQVSQCASAQVGVDCSRVCLKKLSGCVDCLVIRLALECWLYWVREACHDVLDGGVLHLDVLGGQECIFVLLMKNTFLDRRPKETLVLRAGYSLG
jgi:hypothetical protein